ncbi:efflux RND transporter periplasmic adaptor subunit [Desulfosporosinus sp. PR]|uniref:efflux RND transporter periplasmic adaptor subunit n=1 Tax=Candidatus Desulfosporosinus nitrosoreducens TaxID=3401928 RepID=UPI0027F59284|nr:efflux RND transporter periplasmic adaptor subunit [Desulfosporosinus sp. PR]MDQ7096546.1 efflux RND transporter periplasmic adaptor subunit [Desulfosporosinus sp. PR]
MKKGKKIVAYCAVILIAFAGIRVYRSIGAVSPKPTIVNKKTSVQVQATEKAEIISGITYNATLEPYEEGIVSSMISGQVVQILFSNSDSVSKGQTLVVLDDKDLRNQLEVAEMTVQKDEITVQKMEASWESSQRDYDRTRALFENGAISKADYENAETSLKLAKANLESEKVTLESEKVTLQSINNSLENCIIRAPISGVMDDKSVNLGQITSPGPILAKVKNISLLYAVVQVEQENVNNLKLGQKAIINNGNDSIEGVVKSIDVSADPSVRALNCKILVDNKHKLLHPGDYAKVEIPNEQKIQTMTIPLEALAGDEGNYYIFVNDKGVARRRSVTIGDTTQNRVEIKSGVLYGDSVICTNVNTLQDGDEITVVSEQGGNR